MINTNLNIEDIYHVYDISEQICRFHLDNVGYTLILEWCSVWEMRRGGKEVFYSKSVSGCIKSISSRGDPMPCLPTHCYGNLGVLGEKLQRFVLLAQRSFWKEGVKTWSTLLWSVSYQKVLDRPGIF